VPGDVPPQATFGAWVQRVDATDIPPRVLRAYATAEQAVRAKVPACHVTWATIAAVGRIGSKNGIYQGSAIDDAGMETSPVIGIPLEGSSGVLAVPASTATRGTTPWARCSSCPRRGASGGSGRAATARSPTRRTSMTPR